MELIQKLNGMNHSDSWKKNNNKQSKGSAQDINNHPDDNSLSNDTLAERNKFKEILTELQGNVTESQDRINILQIASETLNTISGSLEEIRELAIETINQLDSYDLKDEIKHKLENINNLNKLNQRFEGILDPKDQNYSQILYEFKNVSDISIKLAKIQGFEKHIDDNIKVDEMIQEINTSISSVCKTKNNLDEFKNSLIVNIKSLSITLENLVSSYNRIRNVDQASQIVKLAQNQILHNAQKSVSIQLTEYNSTVNQLMS